jgi:peptide/nickel transport system substrate-binding protein
MDREFYSGTDDAEAEGRIVKHGASFASDHAAAPGRSSSPTRAGREARIQALRRLLGQGLAGNVDRSSSRRSRSRHAGSALLAGDVDFIAPVPPTDFDRSKSDSCCTLITMLERASSPSS